MAGRSAGAVFQPGAKLGEETYCPVSGVVFAVSEATPVRTYEGGEYHFCCPACAAHFDQHASKIVATRSAWRE